MLANDLIVKVDGLGKCYQVYDQPKDRFKQMVWPRLRRLMGCSSTRYYRDFWALQDVSFEVGRGETVGILGRNGSGKSTLLQMVCGMLTPTVGSIETSGRIAALLELGSGFNPDFTGRENVYLNGMLLGLSRKEIDARFDQIVDFSGVEPFIDQPVKHYSSGMMVRLAFAVQTQVSPDLLVVDEALAVGDAKFQAKCFERLKQLKDQGTSILFVTHATEQVVAHCSRALLFDSGSLLVSGEPRSVVNSYLDLLFGKERITSSMSEERAVNKTVEKGGVSLSHTSDVFYSRPGYNPNEYRWGDRAAEILDYQLLAGGEQHPSVVGVGEAVTIFVAVRFIKKLIRPILGCTIKTKEGVTVCGANSEMLNVEQFKQVGQKEGVAVCRIDFSCRLAAGDYFISLGVATCAGEEIVPHDRRYDAIHLVVEPTPLFFGLADLDLEMSVCG